MGKLPYGCPNPHQRELLIPTPAATHPSHPLIKKFVAIFSPFLKISNQGLIRLTTIRPFTETESAVKIYGNGLESDCFIVSLVYIKNRLPQIDNNSNSTAALIKKEIELAKQIENIDASEIKDASVNITIDENDVYYAAILLYCVDAPSTELEKQIYKLLENELVIDEENIYIMYDGNYLSSEIIPSQDARDYVVRLN